jgi:hypothetical protein
MWRGADRVLQAAEPSDLEGDFGAGFVAVLVVPELEDESEGVVEAEEPEDELPEALEVA